MVKSWLFELPVLVPDKGATAHETNVYSASLRLWERAEALGFHGIFFSEHHAPVSLGPSPHLLMAALAVRTNRLRLATLALTAPMYHPARIAEEIGILDHLSDGRIEYGLARGSTPQEVEAIGVAADEMQPRFEEALDIVEGALTASGPFDYEGRYYRCERLIVSPKTRQKPLPRGWIPVLSTGSSAFAARRGYNICAGFRSTAHVAEMFDAYRRAAAAAGREVGPEQLGLRRVVLVHPDERIARRLSEGVMNGFARFEAVMNLVTDDEIIAGTAEQVTEHLLDQLRETGAGHLAIYGGPQIAHAEYEASVELYAATVMPLLQAEAVSMDGVGAL
jgi:alkanesulfonate monooxygenase SsuD/methylene tetrahydromethanopterin reductase-like flavin-dependent oxidoreductase (luciferase family)